jgi:hypothetical protein
MFLKMAEKALLAILPAFRVCDPLRLPGFSQPQYVTSDHRVAGSSPGRVQSESQSRLAGASSSQRERELRNLLANR